MSYDDPPSMAPCVNIAHEITETSPLWGKSAAEIELEEGAIIVSIAAVDDVSLQASGSCIKLECLAGCMLWRECVA